jgi:hypothetical protein
LSRWGDIISDRGGANQGWGGIRFGERPGARHPGTKKGRSEQRCGPDVTRATRGNASGRVIGYLPSSSPEDDELDELWPSEWPHDGAGLGAAGLGAAQLGAAGTGVGAGAGLGAGAGFGAAIGAAGFGAAGLDTAGLDIAGLAAFFLEGLFLALAFLADFFGAAALDFALDFLADFFADFLAFFADFFAAFFEDFFADFFFAVTTFFLLFLLFFFFALAIVILLLPPNCRTIVTRAFEVVRLDAGPIDQFDPGPSTQALDRPSPNREARSCAPQELTYRRQSAPCIQYCPQQSCPA